MLFKAKIIYYWLKIKWRKPFNHRAALEAFQQKKLNQFSRRVLNRSPFYKKWSNILPFDGGHFPMMNKETFMAQFDEINTCGIKLNQAMSFAIDAEKSKSFKNDINGITVGLSTGTSGKRGLFLVSEKERALWVALVMTRVIQPKFYKKQKIAFFLRANSNLYASVESSLFQFQYFDIFQPITQLLQELQTFSPHILAAQPSILMEIAQAKKLNQLDIQPYQIISFAEVLHASDRMYITENLKAPITEVYQCTEGFLGSTCSQGTMHLHEDFILFDKEWLDEDKFCPIITDFSRESQPIVRYKLNDILQIKKNPCSCGSPLLALEKIIGRDDDVLLIQGKKIYPDLLVRRIALVCNEFQNYTIFQISPTQLEIQIECTPDQYQKLTLDFEKAISELFMELKITHFEMEFKCQNVRTAGNKLRKVINKI